jgi:hypothetical protein
MDKEGRRGAVRIMQWRIALCALQLIGCSASTASAASGEEATLSEELLAGRRSALECAAKHPTFLCVVSLLRRSDDAFAAGYFISLYLRAPRDAAADATLDKTGEAEREIHLLHSRACSLLRAADPTFNVARCFSMKVGERHEAEREARRVASFDRRQLRRKYACKPFSMEPQWKGSIGEKTIAFKTNFVKDPTEYTVVWHVNKMQYEDVDPAFPILEVGTTVTVLSEGCRIKWMDVKLPAEIWVRARVGGKEGWIPIGKT